MPPKRKNANKKEQQEQEDGAIGPSYSVSGVKWFMRKIGMKTNACLERHKAQFVMIDGMQNTMMFASMPSWKHVFHATIRDLEKPYYKHLFEGGVSPP